MIVKNESNPKVNFKLELLFLKSVIKSTQPESKQTTKIATTTTLKFPPLLCTFQQSKVNRPAVTYFKAKTVPATTTSTTTATSTTRNVENFAFEREQMTWCRYQTMKKLQSETIEKGFIRKMEILSR